MTEGDEVTLDWPGMHLSGVVEEVYEDGGCRVKCGPSVWIYLPAPT
jgi:hypothetical protein